MALVLYSKAVRICGLTTKAVRTLYAACVDLKSRHEWSPGGDKLNVSGRTPNGRFIALSIDSPGLDGNYGASRLKITGDYLGPAGSKAIDPNGFDVEILPNNRLRFWMTNFRPPVDSVSGEYLDATKVGANATVESFELIRGENTLQWTGTFGANSGVVHSPNKAKLLQICIGVYSLSPTALTKIDEIEVGMPIDNLSIDTNGDIFAGAFPDSLKLIQEVRNPTGVPVPGTVWQIGKASRERNKNGNAREEENGNSTSDYRVWKVLEDKAGKVLPSEMTTAVHDVKTGRIFLGAVLSKHITVCEPIPIAR